MSDEIGNRTPLASDQLASAVYLGPPDCVLEIEFRRGGIYQYDRVSEKTAVDLFGARSFGKFFHDHIRDQFVTYRLIDGNRVRLDKAKFSDKARGFLLVLAKQAGLPTKDSVSSAWRSIISECGLDLPEPGAPLDDYLRGLRHQDGSKLINHFKPKE